MLVASSAGAQREMGTEREDLRVLRSDVWYVVTAPARAEQKAIVRTLGAVAAVAVVAPFDSVIYAWMKAHPDAPLMRAIAPIRENYRFPIYELGSALYLMPLSTALYAGGRLADEPNVRDAGLGCFAAEVSSSALRVAIQLLVNRDRPRESLDAGHVSAVWQRKYRGHSFPSGHVANPAACAAFLSHRFELGVAEPLMGVYVGALALARIADAQHWASDVVAGAAMGYAIGRALANRQHERIRSSGEIVARRSPVYVPLWSYAF